MSKVTSILYLFAIAVLGQALTPSTYLTTVDVARLKSVFEAAQPFTDVANAHYSILGLKLLGATISNSQEACKKVTSLVDGNSVASLYHASEAAKALGGGCKISAGGAQQVLSNAIKDSAPVIDIFQAYFALKNLGLSVDNAKVTAALTESLKKDDSPSSYGYAFILTSDLPGDAKKMFDSIEDIIAQADEVDEKYLQFEAGLFTTSLVIDGAYKLAEKQKKAPTMSDDKVVKFANYFLSRKHVHQLKAACQLVSAIKTLTDNKFHIPVAVTLSSSVDVSAAAPTIKVKVTNLLGGSVGSLSVMADSAKRDSDGVVFLSKKPFTVDKKDSSLFELDFMQAKPACGFYKIAVSAKPQKEDKRLLGTTGAAVEVKVTTQVAVENVEIGVADKDQSTAAKTSKLQYPGKASSALEADYHQKVIIKFSLKEKSTGKSISAHQTFVKLTNEKTDQEIMFVAEGETAASNKFELDIGSNAARFGHLSGKYSVELIVGDAVIENPVQWYMVDIVLTFPEAPAKQESSQGMYSKRPEIKHLFREAEKRPPAVVSTAFTGLCLAPLAILFLVWLKIGANMSNFPMSLSAIGFHICLAGIFVLYYFYWVKLNMFETVRYLGFLGIPTFIFGNRLLSGIASQRKGEKKM